MSVWQKPKNIDIQDQGWPTYTKRHMFMDERHRVVKMSGHFALIYKYYTNSVKIPEALD